MIFGDSVLLVALISRAQNVDEKVLSDVGNAYNPIPGPDGMGTSRGKRGIRSLQLALRNLTDEVLSPTSLANAFLFGWTLVETTLSAIATGIFHWSGLMAAFHAEPMRQAATGDSAVQSEHCPQYVMQITERGALLGATYRRK